MISVWLNGYRKLFQFSGRERRTDFRKFILVQGLLLIIGVRLLEYAGDGPFLLLMGWWFASNLAFAVRRGHDAGAASAITILAFLLFHALAMGWLIFAGGSFSGRKYGADPRSQVEDAFS